MATRCLLREAGGRCVTLDRGAEEASLGPVIASLSSVAQPLETLDEPAPREPEAHP